MYDERFAHEYGPWRPVVAQVTDKFLACGILEHGVARIADLPMDMAFQARQHTLEL